MRRELRRPENKQLDGQTFLTGAAWNKIRLNAKQNLTGFHASLLHPVPRVRLKPPLPKQVSALGLPSSRTKKQMARLLVGIYKLSKPFSPGSELP